MFLELIEISQSVNLGISFDWKKDQGQLFNADWWDCSGLSPLCAGKDIKGEWERDAALLIDHSLYIRIPLIDGK